MISKKSSQSSNPTEVLLTAVLQANLTALDNFRQQLIMAGLTASTDVRSALPIPTTEMGRALLRSYSQPVSFAALEELIRSISAGINWRVNNGL